MTATHWPARALFWLLLPISLLQGIRLRRTATRLPPAPGPRRSCEGRGKPLRLLAIGDSIVDGVGLESTAEILPVQFATVLARRHPLCVHWRLEGRNGVTVAQLLRALNSLRLASAPDIVLVSVGVNDVTGLTSRRRWREGLDHLLDRFRERWPDAFIILLGLPEMDRFPLLKGPLRLTLGWRAAMLDELCKRAVSGRGGMCHLACRIDPHRHAFCADGFHPAADTCKLWADGMLQHLGQRRDFRDCISAATRRAD